MEAASISARDLGLRWYWNFTYTVQNETYIFDSINDFVNATQHIHSGLQPVQPVDIAGVRAAIYFNLIIFVALMLLYEVLRILIPTVYFSRQMPSIETQMTEDSDRFEDNPVVKNEMHSPVVPVLGKNTNFFKWINPINGISWRRIREAAGLDAYFYLRYIRMCYRITTVTALWGFIALFPVYWTGNNGAEDWYHLSMANVSQGSSWRIWVSTLFMYMFSFFVFYVMKNELTHYMELRLDFLGKGEKDVNPQQNYSIMLENVPKELRSDRALYDYFNKLFPGKVHSASVMLNLPELEARSVKKIRITRRLEKSIAHYEATKKRPTHIMGRPRLNCMDIECSPLECTFCKGSSLHNMETDGEVNRGERVDSIQYYTYDLQKTNCDLFLLQKEKLSIADAGNRSLRATGWFSAVSKIADMFIEENDDYDNSYEDSDWRSNSESWNHSKDASIDAPQTWSSSEGFTWSGSKDQKEDISHDMIESKDSDFDGISWANEEGGFKDRSIDSADGSPPKKTNESSRRKEDKSSKVYNGGILRTKVDDPKKLNNKGTQESLTRQKEPNRDKVAVTSVKERNEASDPINQSRGMTTVSLGKIRNNVSGELVRNSSINSSFRHASLDEDQTASFRKPNKLKRVKWSLTRNKSDGIIGDLESQSREEPLIDNSYLEGVIRSHSIEEKEDGKDSKKEEIEKKKVVSRLGGRLGLDFAMYGVQLLNRKLLKTFDTPDECRFMSSTAFVTFYDLASVTFAAGVPLTHSPDSLDVTIAPEARDVIWENAHLSKLKTTRRINTVHVFLLFGVFFWGIPVALIQMLSSANSVARLPGMSWVLEAFDGYLAVLIDAYLPVVMLLGLILILPMVLEDIAMNYERRKTRSDIDRCVVDRYFYYQLANIYICVTAGSVWKSAATFLDHPGFILEILGNAVPTLVGYFIAMLVTKIFGGLPTIMLRCTALGRYLILRMIHRKRFLTQRDLDQVHRQEPVWYGWEYPNQLMVIAICFTYACISPIILIFGALFFFVSLMVYKKQVLYVYTPSYESGGALFPMVIDRTIVGLICGQITFIGYTYIRGGFYQPLFLAPLVYISFWMMRYFDTRYGEPSKKLTLERAIELDEKIGTFSVSKRGVRPASPGKRKNAIPPQIAFTSDYYRQPVLTEPPGEPLPYRSGRDDPMTIEARVQLSQNRVNMWSPDTRFK